MSVVVSSNQTTEREREYWSDMNPGERFSYMTSYLFCIACFITALVIAKMIYAVVF
jgi:hypothetical protein